MSENKLDEKKIEGIVFLDECSVYSDDELEKVHHSIVKGIKSSDELDIEVVDVPLTELNEEDIKEKHYLIYEWDCADEFDQTIHEFENEEDMKAFWEFAQIADDELELVCFMKGTIHQTSKWFYREDKRKKRDLIESFIKQEERRIR